MGQKAQRGIFVTTCAFSKDAVEYAEGLEARIDGQRLSSLMIEYDLGVMAVRNYVVKRGYTDYFVED